MEKRYVVPDGMLTSGNDATMDYQRRYHVVVRTV